MWNTVYVVVSVLGEDIIDRCKNPPVRSLAWRDDESRTQISLANLLLLPETSLILNRPSFHPQVDINTRYLSPYIHDQAKEKSDPHHY